MATATGTAEGMFATLLGLAADGRTGTLEVRRGEVKSILRFRAGRLLFPGGEALSAYLLREGRLSREAAEAASGSRNPGEDLADALVRTGALTREELESAALEYLDRFLEAIAGWSAGETEFREAPDGDPAHRSWGTASCTARILAVVRSKENPGAIVPIAGDDGATLEPIAADGGPPDLNLKAEEAYLLSRITPGTRVKEILAMSPVGADQTRRTLAVLIAIGLVKGTHSASFRYTSKRMPAARAKRSGWSKKKKSSRAGGKKSALRKPAAPPANRTGLPPATEVFGGEAPPPEDLGAELMTRIQELEGSNYYQILGVSQSAGTDEIRHRYYDLARKFHPDRYQKTGELQMAEQAEKLLSHVTEAYRILSEAGRRAEYNQKLAEKIGKDVAQADPKQMARENCQAALHLFATGQLAKAAQFLENAVQLDPNNDQYLCHLAEVQMRNPRLRPEARRNLQQALKLNPSNPDVLVQIGQLFEREGKPQEAVKKYEEALNWDPDHGKAKRFLEMAAAGKSSGRKRRGFFGR